jgi:hypothetical protein
LGSIPEKLLKISVGYACEVRLSAWLRAPWVVGLVQFEGELKRQYSPYMRDVRQ